MAVSVERIISGAFGDIPEVESVYLCSSGDLLSVMTVIDDDRDAAYDKIYEQERHVIRSLPSYEFDFTVIARRGRPIEDLVGFNAPVWQRHKSECHVETSI